jgi:hypothetical protein
MNEIDKDILDKELELLNRDNIEEGYDLDKQIKSIQKSKKIINKIIKSMEEKNENK